MSGPSDMFANQKIIARKAATKPNTHHGGTETRRKSKSKPRPKKHRVKEEADDRKRKPQSGTLKIKTQHPPRRHGDTEKINVNIFTAEITEESGGRREAIRNR